MVDTDTEGEHEELEGIIQVMCDVFPRLTRQNFQVVEKYDGKSALYNCVSWSFHLTDRKWWPAKDAYWPPGHSIEATIENFIATYIIFGYEKTDSYTFEQDYERVVIYAEGESPRHVTRQLPTGRWTSKIGDLTVIEHDDLECLEGESYGSVCCCLRKKLT